MGIVGAWLADLLVARAFGLWSLVLAGLAVVWGWALFRHRPLLPLVFPSLAALLGMGLGAAFVGWWDVGAEADLLRGSGALGKGTATALVSALGRAGSFLVLLLLLAVVALVFVEKDVQHLADHAERLFVRLRDSFSAVVRWTAEHLGGVTDRLRALRSDDEEEDDPPETVRPRRTRAADAPSNAQAGPTRRAIHMRLPHAPAGRTPPPPPKGKAKPTPPRTSTTCSPTSARRRSTPKTRKTRTRPRPPRHARGTTKSPN